MSFKSLSGTSSSVFASTTILALRQQRYILAASIAALISAVPTAGTAAELIRDANAATLPNPVDGGGDWNTTGLNWWNGTTNVAWTNSTADIAVFGASTTVPAGIPGNINVIGTITAGGLKFNPYVGNNTRYNITGGTSLTLGGAATITVNTDWTRPFAAVNSVISGSSGLTIQGNGSGILEIGTQAHNFTGGVTLQDKATLSIGSNSGLGAVANSLTFTGNATLIGRGSFTIENGRNITINAGSTATFDTVGANNRTTVASAIGGVGNLKKDGHGTLELAQQNTYTGETHVHQGTLLLNFDAGFSSNIINPASTLRLSGGTLQFQSGSGASQTFNGLNVSSGHSTIDLAFTPGATLNLGAINRTAGGTLHIGSEGSNITTTTANVNGILGGYATAENFLTNDIDWVTVTDNGTTKVLGKLAESGYSTSLVSGSNVDVRSALAPISTTTINSLKISSPDAITINDGNTLTISSGGLLVSRNALGTVSITGGTINAGSGADLIVHQHNVNDPLTISSVIADNGGTALTKNGPGTLILNGANTYTGNTYLNAGTLDVNSDAALGVGTGATVTSRAGTTVRFSGSSAITSSKNFIFDYGANSYGGAALNGGPNSIGDFNVDVTNTAGVTISGAFNVTAGTMVKSGAGALTLTNSGVNNLARIDGGLAFTVSGGTLTFDGGAASEWRIGQGEFTIGDNTPMAAVVNVNSGKVSTGSWVSIGRGNGTEGLESGINVNGGSLNTGHLYTGFANGVGGYNAKQFITASGSGVINVSDDLRTSESVGSATKVTLSGNSALNVSDRIELGFGGTSVMTINDNATVVTTGLGVGGGDGNAGNTGAAAIYQNGGSLSRAGFADGGDWRIGGVGDNQAQAWGLYQITAGTLNTGRNNFQVGAYGAGVLDVRGGTVNTNTGGGFIVVGRYANSLGVLNVSGNGAFNVNNTDQLLIIGENGTGVVNMSGGTMTVLSNGAGIRLGHTAEASATFNLNGGVVQTNGIGTSNADSRSNLYLNGGTLKAGANNTAFLQGLDQAVVGAGGAIFDTNGNNITVAQDLAPGAGNGITNIALANFEGSGGIGYLGQPVVRITGNGTGATAVANVDPATGRVTSITITNPGINYTEATVELVGGGSTLPAQIGTITFGANAITGGLTKNGTGTLTLSGNNSYAGVTTVNAGTLTVTRQNAAGGGLSIASGATVNFNSDGNFFGHIAGPATVNGTLNLNRTGDYLYTSSLLGTGTVNKNGTNAVFIDGASNFTGTLNVNGGSLVTSGTFGSTIAVNNTAKIVPVANNVGTVTVGGLSLGTGSTTDFEFTGSSNDKFVITGENGLSFGSAFTLNFFDVGSTNPFSTVGSYVLFDYTGAFTGNLSNLLIGNPASGKSYALVNDPGSTEIRLEISAMTPRSWTNAGGGTWTTSGNWTDGVIPVGAGSEAVFGSAITAPATIDLDGNKTVGRLVFNNANAYTLGGTGTLTLDNGAAASVVTVNLGNHVISAPVVLATNTSVFTADLSSIQFGDISGAKPLTTSGTGTVILTGNSSYTDTNINGGTVQVGNGGTTGSLGTGSVTIGSATARLAFNRSDDITVSTNISGTGGLAHNGAGAITYKGSATYTGPTAFNNGAFNLEGTITGTSALTVDNITTLKAGSSLTVAGPTNVAATRDASLNIDGTANATLNGLVNVGGSGTTGTFTMTGGTVTQTGGGNGLRFGSVGSNSRATSTISGGTVTSQGELWLSNGVSNQATMTISGGNVSTSNWIAIGREEGIGELNLSGGSLNKTAGGDTHIIIGSLGGVGTLNQSGDSILTTTNDLRIGENRGAVRSEGNKWTMTGGTATITGTLNVAWRGARADVELSNGSITTGRLVIGSEQTSTGTVTVKSGTLTINGGGESRIGGDLSGAADSEGFLNIEGGAVSSSGNFQIGGYGKGTVNMTGGTLSFNGWTALGRFEGSQGTLNLSGGTVTHANDGNGFLVAEGGTGILNVSGTGLLDVRNLRVGHGDTGNGTVNLLEGGTIATRLVQKSSLISAAAFNFNGGVLKASASSDDFFLGFQDGQLNILAGGAKIDTNGSRVVITQGLSKPMDSTGGGLTKQGVGELVLRGGNFYDGPTNVLGGALLVSGSIAGTTGVTVESGATFGGSGQIETIANGNVILKNGALLDPGDDFGSTLNFLLGTDGKLDLSAATDGNAFLKFALGMLSDKVTLTNGSLNIGTGLDFGDFAFTNFEDFGEGTYTLFATNNTILGTLGTNLTGSVAGLNATLGFADNNTDLVLTVVPEPSAAISLLVGAGAILGMRRRPA